MLCRLVVIRFRSNCNWKASKYIYLQTVTSWDGIRWYCFTSFCQGTRWDVCPVVLSPACQHLGLSSDLASPRFIANASPYVTIGMFRWLLILDPTGPDSSYLIDYTGPVNVCKKISFTLWMRQQRYPSSTLLRSNPLLSIQKQPGSLPIAGEVLNLQVSDVSKSVSGLNTSLQMQIPTVALHNKDPHRRKK